MQRIERLSSASALLLAALAGAACDSVAHEDYKGEPLATIRGQAVVADPAFQPPPAEVVLLWGQANKDAGPADDPRAFNLVAERVPVTGGFPAEFTLELRQPPPASARFIEHGGAHLNVATITAYKQGVLKTGPAVLDPDDPEKTLEALSGMLGQAAELVFYLDRDVPADHPISVITGGINKQGFHLVEAASTPLAERQRRQQACLVLFPGGSSLCELDPGDDSDVALVPGGFEGRRIRVDIRKSQFATTP
jgi:hypothetical protein